MTSNLLAVNNRLTLIHYDRLSLQFSSKLHFLFGIEVLLKKRLANLIEYEVNDFSYCIN